MKAFSTEIDGTSLLTFMPVERVNPDTALQFAVMVAKYKETFLLVYNRFRECWELPGGLVELGETVQKAAVREFLEETGQTASQVRLLGLLEVHKTAKPKPFSGVLYGCEVVTLKPFTPNEEISELALWHGQEIAGVCHQGQVSSLDRRLITLYDMPAYSR